MGAGAALRIVSTGLKVGGRIQEANAAKGASRANVDFFKLQRDQIENV